MTERTLLDATMNSWERNNTVLNNLLGALPQGGLEARAMEGSPTVAEMLTHMHYERMVSVFENAPEYAGPVPAQEWVAEPEPERIVEMLAQSARVVRDAVEGRLAAGRGFDLDYDDPIQLVHFLIFHEGYHHGQIKLALKAAGRALPDAVAGPITWQVWRRRTGSGQGS